MAKNEPSGGMLVKRLTFVFSFVLVILVTNTGASIRKDIALTFPRNYAKIILEEAQAKDGREAISLIKKSLILYPGNPDAYFLLAKKRAGNGLETSLLSVKYYFKGIYYTIFELWHLMNISAVLLVSIALAIVVSLTIFFIVRISYTIPFIVHEITENPRKVLFLLLLIPSILGYYFTLSGLLFFSLVCLKKRGLVFGLILFLLMFLSLLTFRFFQSYIKVAFSPETRSIISVNTGQSNANAIHILQGHNDDYSLFSYALALQKEMRLNKARDVYGALLKKMKDERILVNLASVNLLLGNLNEAESLIKQAIDKRPTVTAYYNMSIIQREKLDFEKGDEYFTKAINMDFDRVTLYRDFVSRETLPLPIVESFKERELLSMVLSKSLQDFYIDKKTLFLIVYIFILMILLFLRQKDSEIPMQCKKCGKIFCLKCERRLHWGNICVDCFKNLITLEKDPEERIKTILKTYEYQQRRRRVMSLLSFIIPGFALLVSERFMRGLVILASILFFLYIVFFTDYFSVNIQQSDYLYIKLLSLIMVVIIYTFGIFYIKKRIRKGWL